MYLAVYIFGIRYKEIPKRAFHVVCLVFVLLDKRGAFTLSLTQATVLELSQGCFKAYHSFSPPFGSYHQFMTFLVISLLLLSLSNLSYFSSLHFLSATFCFPVSQYPAPMLYPIFTFFLAIADSGHIVFPVSWW